MSFRTVTEVDVAGDDWHTTTDAGDWVDEAVLIGGVLYDRSAADAAALADEPWGIWPDDPAATEAVDHDDLVDQLRVMVEDSREFGDDDVMIEEMLVTTVGGYYLSGVAGPAPLTPGQQSLTVTSGLPVGFVDLLGSFTDAELVDDSGVGLTLRATRQITEDIGYPVPPGEFEIVLDGDDRPVSLRLVVEGDTSATSQRSGSPPG